MKRKAELIKINKDDRAIQYITDSMANKMPIKIEYKDSGWRTCLPYSWTLTKDNNLLIMCYKQDSSIRSYRYDRIYQILVEESIVYPQSTIPNKNELLDEESVINKPEDFVIPPLPNIDEIIEETENEEGNESPYEEAEEIIQEALDNVDINLDEQKDVSTETNEIEIPSLEEENNDKEISEEDEDSLDFNLDEEEDEEDENGNS